MTTNCFSFLFCNCTALSSAPALPATTLAEGCYYRMFDGCTGLTRAPALPATTLAESCYEGMFDGCTALTDAPALPATTLAEGCYDYMFYGCTALTNAPVLPATTLADHCYGSMFAGCTGLKNAPMLPATTLAESCYEGMFYGCTALTCAPALPATTLAAGCYGSMFSDCTALTDAPALPATTLAEGCYDYMFYGCTALTRVPELPATTLAKGCYMEMFYGCTGIMLNTEGPGMPWSIPANANAAGATNWNLGMFAGTGGTFQGDPEIGTVYYHALPPPPGYTPYITFSSANPFTLSLPSKSWNSKLYTSTNATDWNEITAASTITAGSADGVYKLHLRGTGNTRISSGHNSRWTIDADPGTVACSGNIETLLDHATVTAGAHPAMTTNCFSYLFRYCTALSSAPALPATTLAAGCYGSMFIGCRGLTHAPTLPATTLAEGCYSSMFDGCTALTCVPELPATTLAVDCYMEMFYGCTGIMLNTEGPGMPWSIPANANAAGATDWNLGMFAGTGGTFQGDPAIGTVYYYTVPPPPGYTPYITFSSANPFTLSLPSKSWDGRLYTSTDTINWNEVAAASTITAGSADGVYKLYFRGTGNTRISSGYGSQWAIGADPGTVACSGNIETLLDHATVTAGAHPAMTTN
jgi:hypothetical protein